MTSTTLEAISRLLGSVAAPGSFTARQTAAADNLHLEVSGLGRLEFPISHEQAQRLARLARPARHGLGEQTILDKRVRDTGEIPKSRLKIAERRWEQTLMPVLDALRADLGAPPGCRLRAALHNMLVYGPGQFFVPHRDSEKVDDMVGTLVVTLPSSFQGGAIVVEHQGERAVYRALKHGLSFIAFYADCRHEVRPVRAGHRIVLTYNLMLADDPLAPAERSEAAVEGSDVLAEQLREHFKTPLPPNKWLKDAPPREPPRRLVYLLDHQYTERGLGWRRLKGQDHARVAALRAAAERASCEMVLAIADVHETWDCESEGWDEPRRRRWDEDDEDDQIDFDEPNGDVPDGYTVGDLQDRSITLQTWIDQSGDKAEPITTNVGDEEVCSTSPASALHPYASEHQGYTGNEGNTVDRWYRRGAIVLWPRARAFAVRAEASPAWALEALSRQIRTGALGQAQENAAALAPFWNTAARGQEQRRLFAKAVSVALGLDTPALAASLLRPFCVEAITVRRAKVWVKLVPRYGEGWVLALLAEWSAESRRGMRSVEPDRLSWLASLADVCEALRAADAKEGRTVARLLLQDQWCWLHDVIAQQRAMESPPQRDQALASLSGALLGYFQAAAAVEAADLRDEALGFLCTVENERLLGCLLRTLRLGASTGASSKQDAVGLSAIAQHCAGLLETRLLSPARRSDDWSIPWPERCKCKLCATLGAFLGDRAKTRLEWPLAEQGRRHVHSQLDTHELPVSHHSALGPPLRARPDEVQGPLRARGRFATSVADRQRMARSKGQRPGTGTTGHLMFLRKVCPP